MDKTIESSEVVTLDDICEYVAKDGSGKYFKYIDVAPHWFCDIGAWEYDGLSGSAVEIEPIPELKNVAPEDSLRRVV